MSNEGERAYERATQLLDTDRPLAVESLAEAIRRDPVYRHTPAFRKLRDEVEAHLALLEQQTQDTEEDADHFYIEAEKGLNAGRPIEEVMTLLERAIVVVPEYGESPLARRIHELAGSLEGPPIAGEQTMPDTFADLKQLRKDLKLTQEQLGWLLNVSKMTILRLETGKGPGRLKAKQAEKMDEVRALHERVKIGPRRQDALEELARLFEESVKENAPPSEKEKALLVATEWRKGKLRKDAINFLRSTPGMMEAALRDYRWSKTAFHLQDGTEVTTWLNPARFQHVFLAVNNVAVYGGFMHPFGKFNEAVTKLKEEYGALEPL